LFSTPTWRTLLCVHHGPSLKPFSLCLCCLYLKLLIMLSFFNLFYINKSPSDCILPCGLPAVVCFRRLTRASSPCAGHASTADPPTPCLTS
jgi:hypothetical protein